jgi:predicted dehydrogenase
MQQGLWDWSKKQMEKVRLAVIGCGNISDAYLNYLSQSEIIELAACSDLDNKKALEKAQKCNIGRINALEEIVEMEDIELILNITPPKAHAGITLKALEKGKNVYSEKPLAAEYKDANIICILAKEKNLLVGCAPDVFLGGQIQAIKKALEKKVIGEPISVSINMMCHGFEAYAKDPEYLYMLGAGPVFDMAVYHLSSIVYLFGPVTSVFSMHKQTFNERMITAPGERYGRKLKVETPTHIMGILKFKNGIIANVNASYDVWDSKLPQIEIYCTKGSISISEPDPLKGINLYEGTVYIRKEKDVPWSKYPRGEVQKGWDLLTDFNANHQRDYCRGLGVVDMAYSIRTGRKHQASMELAAHVVEIMCALIDKNAGESAYKLESGKAITNWP